MNWILFIVVFVNVFASGFFAYRNLRGGYETGVLNAGLCMEVEMRQGRAMDKKVVENVMNCMSAMSPDKGWK